MEANWAKLSGIGEGQLRKRSYYWGWLNEAFRHRWGMADGLSGLLGVIAAIVGFWPGAEHTVNGLGFMAAVFFLGAIIIVRLVLAPYWMAKGDHRRTAEPELVEASRHNSQPTQQTLASLISEGRAFFRQRITTNDEYDIWTDELDGWLRRCADAVAEHFSHAKAKHFLIDPKVSATSWKGAFSEMHNDALSKLDAYLRRLTDM